MRIYKIAALTLVFVLGLAGYAAARTDIQTIKVRVTPSKLDKKKFNKSAKIFVDIDTVADPEVTPNLDQPPSADRTFVDFPPNLKFNTKAAPNCKATSAGLQNTTTSQARSICGSKTVISRSNGTDAEVTIDPDPANPGTPPVIVDVVVTAFNGNAKNELYLHARADAVNNTSVLVGKLKKGPKGYAKTLDVAIPDLLAGAISEFRVTVKKGKYVQARCKQKSATYQARTQYENHAPTQATSVVKCKQKKSKKGKGGGKKK
jgi:hypothetical protein